MGSFEFFDHAADVGLRITAVDLPGLYEGAAQALMHWIGPPPSHGKGRAEAVEVAGEDLEELMVRWLQELLYLFHARHGYVTAVKGLAVEPSRLKAEVVWLPWDETSGHAYQEVKAVTYHGLRVERSGGGWEARVILDI